MRVVYCGSGWWPLVDRLRAHLPADVTLDVWAQRGPLAAAIAGAQVVLPSNAGLPGALIQETPSLRLIQQPAAGYDGIDLAIAQTLGVPVCNAPGTNGASVAEAALFLILSLARRAKWVPTAFAEAQIGAPVGRELQGRRLLIIGRGQSGSALARAAEGLGLRLDTLGRNTSRAELHAALAQADIVSLHCPLDEATRGMLDDPAFAALPSGAWVINCARGPIIDRGALERALDSGRLGGVGLDVYWQEPWDPKDPLYAHPEVITLPHVAGSTEESLDRIAALVAENVRRLKAGAPLLHRVA